MPNVPQPLAFLLMSLLAASPAIAAPFVMPEAPMRLVLAGGPPEDGAYRAGLAIDLPAGWHTYWISPGDAGMPPVIDASGSANLAGLDVRYPVPKRFSDGTSTSLIYEGRVVLPLGVRPAANGPVHLRLSVSIGLCSEVCLPASAELEADLDPAAPGDTGAQADIARAEALVPTPDPAGAARLAVVSRDIDLSRGEARMTVAVTDADDVTDLFALAPPPWSALPPEAAGRDGDRALYRLTLYGPRGGAGLDDLALTFVTVGKAGSTSVSRRLD